MNIYLRIIGYIKGDYGVTLEDEDYEEAIVYARMIILMLREALNDYPGEPSLSADLHHWERTIGVLRYLQVRQARE